jgi:hypothetical protein
MIDELTAMQSIEIGLVVRAILYGLLFTTIGIGAMKTTFTVSKWGMVVAWLCVLVGVINFFMAGMWVAAFSIG